MHTTRYMIDDGSDVPYDGEFFTREKLIDLMGYFRDEDPPRPFRIFAVDLAEVRRDGRSPMIDVTEDLLWEARQAGELSTELHADLVVNAKRLSDEVAKMEARAA